jgi:hypothetical protein
MVHHTQTLHVQRYYVEYWSSCRKFRSCTQHARTYERGRKQLPGWIGKISSRKRTCMEMADPSEVRQFPKRPPSYCALTWSWALAVGGAVIDEGCWIKRADVVEVRTTPLADPYGAVSDGFLRIRGRLSRITLVLRGPFHANQGYRSQWQAAGALNATPQHRGTPKTQRAGPLPARVQWLFHLVRR